MFLISPYVSENTGFEKKGNSCVQYEILLQKRIQNLQLYVHFSKDSKKISKTKKKWKKFIWILKSR